MALYASTRAVTKTYRHKLTPLGLTYLQFLELVVLWEHNGSKISAIGDRLMLDSGTLTPLVKRLESMRHVERRLGTRDERQVQGLCQLIKA
ncbi:MAG: MarR family winged helix-turn-helix transcriptional regulator [Filomicrobium sp.]